MIETDGEVERMYFLFRFHNMDPARVERMPIREKQVLFSFAAYEIAERNAEIESLKKGGDDHGTSH